MKVKLRIVLLLFAAGLLLPLCACAADALPAPGSAPAKVSIFTALIPVVVPLAIAALKFFAPKLPVWTLPLLAPVLGGAADYLSTGTFGAGTLMGAIAGSAGVGLREVVDQIKSRVKYGPKTVEDSQT